MTVLALSVQEPFLLTSEILPSIILGHLSQSSTWSCCDISLSIFTSSVSSSCCRIKSPVCVLRNVSKLTLHTKNFASIGNKNL